MIWTLQRSTWTYISSSTCAKHVKVFLIHLEGSDVLMLNHAGWHDQAAPYISWNCKIFIEGGKLSGDEDAAEVFRSDFQKFIAEQNFHLLFLHSMNWAIGRSDFLDSGDLFQILYNININHNIKLYNNNINIRLYNKILILIKCNATEKWRASGDKGEMHTQ